MDNPKWKLRTSAEPIDQILIPFHRFFHNQTSGGLVLLACTVMALICANSPWAGAYSRMWNTEIAVHIGGYVLTEPLILWVNDALMAAFFFVVGLEIKREILVGELSSPIQAALPIAAAVGGMLVPALFYSAFNVGRAGAHGWGIPMATDIAFALGVVAILGNRVSFSAKVFLTALAIVDDIGATLVIAVFYTESISIIALAISGGFLAAMIASNKLGVRAPSVYALLGLGLWLAFLKSGVHPTIAGVLGAMTIPARTRINTQQFLDHSHVFLKEFDRGGSAGDNVLTNPEQRGALTALETACSQAQTPLQRLERGMHPWVMFAIMPIFALANAGVTFGGRLAETISSPVVIGIVAGLFFGKQIGITLFAWVAVRIGIARLPEGLTWSQIYGMACLGGIGFTMSLFVASLAFRDTGSLAMAKLGILAASVISGIVGWLLLRRVAVTT